MRGSKRFDVDVPQLVALQLHPSQVGEAFEGSRRDPPDLVVVQVDVLQPREQRLGPELLDLVEARVKGLQVEAGAEAVVVSYLVPDSVVVHVQPLQRFWDESKVEPLQMVGRHIQPLEVLLRAHQAIDVFQLIVVKPQSSQVS